MCTSSNNKNSRLYYTLLFRAKYNLLYPMHANAVVKIDQSTSGSETGAELDLINSPKFRDARQRRSWRPH